jgi:hypothetical protein
VRWTESRPVRCCTLVAKWDVSKFEFVCLQWLQWLPRLDQVCIVSVEKV